MFRTFYGDYYDEDKRNNDKTFAFHRKVGGRAVITRAILYYFCQFFFIVSSLVARVATR